MSTLSPAPPASPKPAPTLGLLFILFAKIGATSFGGGISGWMYRDFVDRYHFLTEDEFMSALTISQILPGPNVANLALHIGQKLRGGVGGLVAVMALLVPPMILAVLLSIVLLDLGSISWIHDFLEGLAASAMGLTASVGIRGLKRSYSLGLWPIALSISVFIALFLLKLPLVPVIVGLALVGLVFANIHQRRIGAKSTKPEA
ncbi:MAG: chromate transporter [Alcaligenaceae bacterium]